MSVTIGKSFGLSFTLSISKTMNGSSNKQKINTTSSTEAETSQISDARAPSGKATLDKVSCSNCGVIDAVREMQVDGRARHMGFAVVEQVRQHAGGHQGVIHHDPPLTPQRSG